jgi:hypothetical protein
MRYQQIYAASAFSAGGVVDQIQFRRNESDFNPFTSGPVDLSVSLGYAARSVANPSAVFADNIGANYVQVFDGITTFQSLTPGGFAPFEVVLDVADQFNYDPSKGDLLLDIRVRNSSNLPYLDAAGMGIQNTTVRIHSGDSGGVNATSGFINLDNRPYGLVTQFSFLAPEPTTASLIALAIALTICRYR